jgi:hypothetical protein
MPRLSEDLLARDNAVGQQARAIFVATMVRGFAEQA